MNEHELPTWNEIVSNALESLTTARSALSEARDWLNSDWRPVGSELSDAAADARLEVRKLIGPMEGTIDRAKGALSQARNGTGRSDS